MARGGGGPAGLWPGRRPGARPAAWPTVASGARRRGYQDRGLARETAREDPPSLAGPAFAKASARQPAGFGGLLFLAARRMATRLRPLNAGFAAVIFRRPGGWPKNKKNKAPEPCGSRAKFGGG